MRLIWINISIFSRAIIWCLPNIRYANMISIWENFQIWKNCRMTWRIKIWNNVFINEYTSINAWISEDSSITIGDNVMFWPGVFLQSWDHSFHRGEVYMFASWWISLPIKLWNNVWIWAKTIILKWVEIWDDTVIWAGSVVTKSIPSWVVAVGNPAKVLREIV